MFCLKCGEAIPDGSTVCPKCGADLINKEAEPVVVYASQKELDISEPVRPAKKTGKKVWIGVVGVACIIAAIFIINFIGMQNLKKTLVREWCAAEDSIIKVLDIKDDKMEYRLETGHSWMDTSLGIFDWKPISRNKIKIKRFSEYETFTIEFNDNKDMLIISPAVTNSDDSETWYYID